MKTTIDIADQLFKEAKAVATAEGTTVRSLVEEGLRLALQRHKQGPGFRLPDASFQGDGLRADASLESWSEIRGLIYDGHGG